MKLLYPSDPFQPKSADEIYLEEYEAAVAAGSPVALFSHEEFLMGSFKPRPHLEPGDEICYRGWMLSPTDYVRLCDQIQRVGAIPLTSSAAYELCHYLPRWYPLLSDFTPATYFYSESDDVASALCILGWTGCFLKDYVKSLSTDGGSLVTDLNEIPAVVAKLKKYRGQIEGGLCARQIEDFIPDSEMRHFIFRGTIYSLRDDVPEVVRTAAQKVNSPFFCVDTICRSDGQVRIVELGDGQVSDRKLWPAAQLIKILKG